MGRSWAELLVASNEFVSSTNIRVLLIKLRAQTDVIGRCTATVELADVPCTGPERISIAYIYSVLGCYWTRRLVGR